MVEPWLRGTNTDIAPVQRAVVHALQLAAEDMERWTLLLSPTLLVREPLGLPSVAFQLRHMARSLDRLLTYAEGGVLTAAQLETLAAEGLAEVDGVREEFRAAVERSIQRVRAFAPGQLQEQRFVGRDRLPTTLAGLLVHVADHTQRHSGQAITTAKVLHALANNEAH